jgi:octaprenyl-diphosphate synthase
MLPFHQAVADDFSDVNQLIIDQLHSNVDLVENIGHYLIEAGGKRLRPLLVLLTANALDYQGKQHLDLAAIIEFIHTATLLHDDVVDISSMRRGRLTANEKWGNAPSVLVGDFLYSRAFQMMVAIGEMDIMNTLSNATNIISEGEVQQLVNAKDPTVSEDNYLEVIYKKTGALFEAACEVGAIIAKATPAQRNHLKLFGHHLGLAFQLIDDVLDYEGDSEALGKNIGDDLAEGKPTLPLIYTMREGTTQQADIVAQAIREGGLNNLEAVIDAVKQTGALDYTNKCAHNHADLAIEQLHCLPEGIYKEAMILLANFSVGRSY